MNARIYGRFSSKPQEHGDSRRRQIEGAIEYAKRNNLTIIGEPYFDEAVSGKDGLNLEREFGRLLNDSQEGEFIICEALDRIGRQNPFLLCKLLYDTVQKGITVITFQDGKKITKVNVETLDTQFTVFAGAAVGHADNKRKMNRLTDTTAEALKLAEKGIQTGTLRKYLPECFVWNPETKSIGFDEKKAAVIKSIFQMYADGLGSTVICHKLNEAKVPTIYSRPQNLIGQHKPWIETSIKKILKNEAYAGTMTVKSQKYSCIPNIVSRELFDKVQLLLNRFAQRRGNLTGRINNLFAGIGVCKHCGGTINVNVAPPKKKGHKTCYLYRCKNARLHICSQPHKMLNATTVELAFFHNYFGGSPENHFESKSKELSQKIEYTENRIKKLSKQIANLYDLVEEGDKEAKSRIGERKNEKLTLEHELIVLKGSRVEETNLPSLMDEIRDVMDFEDNDSEKYNQLLAEANPKLEKKLSDLQTRRTLVNILPSILSKVVFDCVGKTIQPITKDGRELRQLDLDSFVY